MKKFRKHISLSHSADQAVLFRCTLAQAAGEGALDGLCLPLSTSLC